MENQEKLVVDIYDFDKTAIPIRQRVALLVLEHVALPLDACSVAVSADLGLLDGDEDIARARFQKDCVQFHQTCQHSKNREKILGQTRKRRLRLLQTRKPRSVEKNRAHKCKPRFSHRGDCKAYEDRLLHCKPAQHQKRTPSRRRLPKGRKGAQIQRVASRRGSGKRFQRQSRSRQIHICARQTLFPCKKGQTDRN